MATSLFALLDDIASVLDDVAALTKVATKKTAGVLGDDLALNAKQVTGVNADRELPVVWSVAKGSFVNKAILVPAALAISAIAPWAITPLLIAGGLFLCYEGTEKLAHRFLHSRAERQAHRKKLTEAIVDPNSDLVALERDKIKGAIRTDFILSAEIIVITLGIVAEQPIATRIAVLTGIAVLMTVGVYGLVAGIVKLDDVGLALSRSSSKALTRVWTRHCGGDALVHEGPVDRGHRCHVPGRRRNPHARTPATGSPARTVAASPRRRHPHACRHAVRRLGGSCGRRRGPRRRDARQAHAFRRAQSAH